MGRAQPQHSPAGGPASRSPASGTTRRLPRPVSLPLFFGLTFLISWGIWLPLAFAHHGIGPFRLAAGASEAIRLFGVLAPAAVALLLTARAGGRAALGAFWARLMPDRVGQGWWLAAGAVYPALLGAAALTYNRLGGDPPVVLLRPASPGAAVLNVALLALAVLGEELGWRGLALPALLRRYRPLPASLLLGLLWATWHLPFWALQASFSRYGPGLLVLNYLFVLPFTVYLTWLYTCSRGSLLLPVACHLAVNLVNVALLPVTPVPGAYGLLIGLQWLLAGAILPRLGAPLAPRHLSPEDA
jgi:membrane protease YdiL (CAAX protease family)